MKTVEDRLMELERAVRLLRGHKHSVDGGISVNLWAVDEALTTTLVAEKKKHEREEEQAQELRKEIDDANAQ